MTPTPCQLTSHRWRRWEQRVATVPRRQIEPEATSQSPGAVPHNQSEALQRHNSTTEALGANWGQPMTRWHNDTPATHLLHTRYTLMPTCFRVMQSATPIFLPGLTWSCPVGNDSRPLDLILGLFQVILQGWGEPRGFAVDYAGFFGIVWQFKGLFKGLLGDFSTFSNDPSRIRWIFTKFSGFFDFFMAFKGFFRGLSRILAVSLKILQPFDMILKDFRRILWHSTLPSDW